MPSTRRRMRVMPSFDGWMSGSAGLGGLKRSRQPATCRSAGGPGFSWALMAGALRGGVAALKAAPTPTTLPLGGGPGLQLAIDGRSLPGERPPIVGMLSVGVRYFDTIGVRIVRARHVVAHDKHSL